MNDWASIKNVFTPQPLNRIKNYFGVDVAIYFAATGFHNSMTLALAIVIIFTLTVGLVFIPVQTDERDTNLYYCPICYTCPYEKVESQWFMEGTISRGCFLILLSFISAVWARIYQQMYRRYILVLEHEWGLMNLHIQDQVRSQYVISKEFKGGKINQWKRLSILGVNIVGVLSIVYTMSNLNTNKTKSYSYRYLSYSYVALPP